MAAFAKHFDGVRDPPGTVCGLLVRGWREQSHAVYLTRDAEAFAVVLHIEDAAGGEHAHTAPVTDNLGRTILKVCNASLASRSQCTHLGHDGTYYLLEAPTPTGTNTTALTWSPRQGTHADLVVSMFVALRAYVAAPEHVRLAALNTAHTEVYQAYAALVEGD